MLKRFMPEELTAVETLSALRQRAEAILRPADKLSKAERLPLFKYFLQGERERLFRAHRAGALVAVDNTTATALGQRPDMVRAAGRVTRAIVEADLGPATGPSGWTAERVVEALQAGGTLRAEPQDLNNR